MKKPTLQINSLLLLLLVQLLQPATAKREHVGTVTLQIGQVTVVAVDQQSRKLSRGDAVYVGDQITTAANGHVHLRFIDEGAVSIRPNSRLLIERYHVDPVNHQQSAIKFKLEQGVIRSISGKATEAAHDRFRLNTPITAIGVLGTDFVVRVEDQEMWAAVYSGAIAVAPLQGSCNESGFGVCAEAALLSDEMGDAMLEFRGRNGQIELKNFDSQVLPQAESNLSTSAVERTSANELAGSSIATGDIAGGEQQTLSDQPALKWARWGAAWTGDTISETFQQVKEGRHVTVGNRNFALFRNDTTLPDLLPQSGSFDFQLQQGQVHYIEDVPMWIQPTAQAATIDQANLNIDFGCRQFSTDITMSHVDAGSAQLNISGDVRDNGIFAASDATNHAAGALTLEGSRASMLFEKTVEGGTFSGITDWKR